MPERILIASDLHLSEQIYSTRPEIVGDPYFGLDQVYKVAIDNQVEWVALLGDVFDTCSPTAQDVVQYQMFSNKLADQGIKLYYIEGQHDRSSHRNIETRKVGWCDVNDRAIHAHGKVLQITDSIKAYCMDWQHSDEIGWELQKIPQDCTWLFCHQAWKELLAAEARSDASFDLLPKHLTKVFTGDKHYHKQILINNDKTVVYSPGCTHIRKKNEPDQHAVYLITNGKPKSIPIQSRIIRTFFLDRPGLEETVEAELANIKKPEFVRPEPIHKPLLFIKHVKELYSFVRSLRDNPDIFVISELYNPVSDNRSIATSVEEASINTVSINNIDSVIRSALFERIGANEEIFNLACMFLEHKEPRKLLDQIIQDTEKVVTANATEIDSNEELRDT